MALIRLLLLPVFAWALVALTAAAQEPHEIGASSRGRVPDGSVRLAAQDLAREIGLDCEVTQAIPLGRDQNEAPHYEVSCAEGPGYRLVGGREKAAFNCLALAAQTPGAGSPRAPNCRLAANRNGARVVAGVARQAGLACRVDDGAMVGLSSAGLPIYEAGCAGTAGAWIEQIQDGWQVADCLTVVARGDACRFTTTAEQLTTFRGWLAGGEASRCNPTQIRYMGEDSTGPLYETACRAGAGFVVRLDAARAVREIIPCPATHVGGGCQLAGGRP